MGPSSGPYCHRATGPPQVPCKALRASLIPSLAGCWLRSRTPRGRRRRPPLDEAEAAQPGALISRQVEPPSGPPASVYHYSPLAMLSQSKPQHSGLLLISPPETLNRLSKGNRMSGGGKGAIISPRGGPGAYSRGGAAYGGGSHGMGYGGYGYAQQKGGGYSGSYTQRGGYGMGAYGGGGYGGGYSGSRGAGARPGGGYGAQGGYGYAQGASQGYSGYGQQQYSGYSGQVGG